MLRLKYVRDDVHWRRSGRAFESEIWYGYAKINFTCIVMHLNAPPQPALIAIPILSAMLAGMGV